MQDIHRQAKKTLENIQASIKKYYNRKVREQRSIEVCDFLMLNGKNIHTKRPSKKLSPKLFSHFKVLERKGSRVYKLDISSRWKIDPVFHVWLFEPYRA